METGTRALIGAAFGATATGELGWARKLLHLIDGSMLVLMDRGFDASDFLAEVAATNAQFLARLRSVRRPPALRHLPDGAFISLIGGVKVRVIKASVTVTCHDGTTYGGVYRLAATLLDHRAYPAQALTALYHERWEHEITYLALRHTLLGGRVLRSGDPAGLKQEMWALLAVYQALRTAITAVQTVPGTDPERQLPDRRRDRPRPAHQRPQHHRARRRPRGRHRPRGPGEPPRPAPALSVRSPGQITAQPLEQAAGKPRTSQRITTITAQLHAGNTSKATRRPESATTTSGP